MNGLSSDVCSADFCGVEIYGVELEAMVRPVPAWTVRGGFTYMHARITDDSAYVATTGRQLSSDRLTFQPDWLANISTDYRLEMGGDDEVVLSAGLFRSEEPTSELQSLMRISYAVFCLKK